MSKLILNYYFYLKTKNNIKLKDQYKNNDYHFFYLGQKNTNKF